MKALASLGGRIDDFLNPIVVKELRQAVRSRFVSGTLILLLIIQLAVAGIYVMFRPAEAASFSEGREINSILYGVLLFSCILFVPLYAGVRLAWERTQDQMDLMYTTTISPGAIVRGKLLSAAVVTALIFSACMPFITFTYLLRGVDLPTVFFVLAIGFVEVLVAVQIAILLACIPTSRVFKVLLGLFALGCLFMYASMGAVSLPMMLFRGGTIYGGWPFWSVAFTVLALTVLGSGYLYVLSVAMISPPSADRMRPVRFYLMALWLLSGVLASLWVHGSGSWAPLDVWTFTWAFGFAFFFPIVLSERETWGQRIRHGIPRSLAARAVSLLVTTGSAGGFFWTLLMILLTWAAYAAVTAAFQNSSIVVEPATLDVSPIVAGIALYGIAYSLTAMLLRRLLGLARLNIPAGHTWLIAYLMIVLGSLAPYIVSFFLYYNSGPSVVFQDRAWMVTSPMMIAEKEFRTGRLIFAACWAGAAFVAAAPLLLGQIAAFRPLEPPASASATTDAPPHPVRGGPADLPRDAAPPGA